MEIFRHHNLFAVGMEVGLTVGRKWEFGLAGMLAGMEPVEHPIAHSCSRT
jgi:hypothetical protein